MLYTMHFPVINTQYISKCITINRRSISVMLNRKNNIIHVPYLTKKTVFHTVWRLILTDRILKGWRCHVTKTKFILCFQSESLVFFYLCVCAFCFILFVCFCIPLMVLRSKQKKWADQELNRRWYAGCIEYLCIFVKLF